LSLVSRLSQVNQGLYVLVARKKKLWVELFLEHSAVYAAMRLAGQFSEDCVTVLDRLSCGGLQRLVLLDWLAQRAVRELCEFCRLHQLRTPYVEQNQARDAVFRVLQLPLLPARLYLTKQRKQHLESDYATLRRNATVARRCLLDMFGLCFSWLREWSKSYHAS
jgi:hypothetical protein